MKRYFLLYLILLSLSFAQTGCKGPSGGSSGGNPPTETGTEPADDFKLVSMSLPLSVPKNEEAPVSADITGKSSEIILFQFLSSNGKNHMVPHSGIIATHDKAGQINLTYKAPAQVGKHYYYFKVLNSEGKEIEKQFDITVVD